MKLSFLQLVFAALPEAFLLYYVGLGLLGIKKDFKRYIAPAVIHTIILFMTRNVLNLFGLHIIILIFCMIILIKLFLKTKWTLAIIASLLGIILLLLGDILIYPLLTKIFNLTPKMINQHLKWFSVVYCITKVHLFLSFLGVYYYDFKLFDLAGVDKES